MTHTNILGMPMTSGKNVRYSCYDSYTKQTTVFDTLGQAKQFIATSICGGAFISGISLVK